MVSEKEKNLVELYESGNLINWNQVHDQPALDKSNKDLVEFFKQKKKAK